MKKEYDFSNGKRGPVLQASGKKIRITIRLDEDIVNWFKKQTHMAGGGSYQAMINAALRNYLASRQEHLETTLRTIIREELARYDIHDS